ncbi:beta-ketoacyl synthase N-terminal-like domain-containing protein [Streptomyces sp. NPDC001941]|uniref:type I polyketide synthase n=1 Tax=Streptomyces sp. NPDC001941 TaxID=3154659 RepID=UPI00332E1683
MTYGGPGGDLGIAVIGTAFRLPGADTPEELWRVVRDGEVRVSRFTEAELAAAGVPEQHYRAPDFVGAGASLDDIAGFDAQHFRVSGHEARITDPQQRLFLECAAHALEDAGYPDERGGTRIGVWASTGYHLYAMQNYLLNNVLPEQAADDWLSRMQVLVGNYADYTATRTAFRLDLTGPAVNVQTACSGSLVGVQQAIQALLFGDCDIALAGAVAVHVPAVLGYRYVKGSILSRSGRLRAFDAAADGTVGGNGVAAVVLKPLARALADGDTVHGVIRGWGVNNDGAGKAAFTAPSARGQRAAIRAALDRAGVRADSIGYFEAHGTGTFKGDPIEFAGAGAAFREDGVPVGSCAVGALKSNIGHLDAASGIAGLIKTLLVLRHGVIPPLAAFDTPNPLLDLEHSPFRLPRTVLPWPDVGGPRRAGVSSLGVGGTNVHLVLEQAPPPRPRTADVPPPDVLLVSGSSPAALADNARALAGELRARPGRHPADLVLTAALGRRHHRHRLAVRGSGAPEFAAALEAWLAGDRALPERKPGRRPGFLFTGQASPYPGMAGALHERFPVVREVVDHCERLYGEVVPGGSLRAALLAGTGGPSGEDPDRPWPTDAAQPALYVLQCALVRLWRECGVRPAVVAGHSVGEYAALYAAGALGLDDGLRLTALRGRLMRERCAPGAMVAVALSRTDASALAAEVPGVELAVTNGADSQVLAGPVAAVARLRALLDARAVPARTLPVDRAFHTSAVEPALPGLEAAVDAVAARPVETRFISAVDGVVREPGWTPGPDHLLLHAREPVRFDLVLAALAAPPGDADDGPAALVEIGPHTTLSGLARRALPGLAALPSLRRSTGLSALWGAAASLHRTGADLDWGPLLAGSGGGRIPLPGYRFQHTEHWTGPPPTAPAVPTPPRNGATVSEQVEQVLRSVVESTARHLKHDPAQIAGDTSFFDLGADSLLMISMLRELEQRYRVKVTMRELLEETGTPGQLARLIADRLPGDGLAPEAARLPDGGLVPEAPRLPDGGPESGATAPAPAAPSPYATREEVAELTRKLEHVTAVQVQMMTQLSQLLTLQAASAAAQLNGQGVRPDQTGRVTP